MNLDYNRKNIYVGIDVHMKNWFCTIKIEDYIKRLTIDANSDKLIQYLQTQYPGGIYVVGYEAGCFGFDLARKLKTAGIEVRVFNPADIPSNDKENRNKTDRVDSLKIAQCLADNRIKGIYIPTVVQEQSRSLIRRRDDLVRKTTRVKNQIKALLKIFGVNIAKEFDSNEAHWSKRFIEKLKGKRLQTQEGRDTLDSLIRELIFLRGELLQINRQMRKLSKEPHYARNVEILNSISGIGTVTSMTFLTEIIDIHRFSSFDKLVSYVGFYPNEHSSGGKQRIGHLTRRKNSHLRYLLIEASWIAVRNDPELEKYYIDKIKVMVKSKVIVKVARKLLSRIRYLLLHNELYKINKSA